MMLDRATTNAIIAAAGLAGDRAQVVRLASRMTGDASELERMARLLRDCDEATAQRMLSNYQAARQQNGGEQ